MLHHVPLPDSQPPVLLAQHWAQIWILSGRMTRSSLGPFTCSPIFFLPSTRLVGYLSIPVEVRREQVTCSGHEIPSAKVVLPLHNSPLNSSFCPQVELSALPVAARDSSSLYFHTSGGWTHTKLIFVASRCPAQCWNIQ